MNSVDDDARFEERIRAGLASRDPGPAPVRLRHRVDTVTSVVPARTAPLRRLVGVVRPAVAATLTIAAVLIGVLVVSMVRPLASEPAGPGASIPAGPIPTADLGTVAAPLALSYGWTVFLGLVALLAAWVAVEFYLSQPSGVGIALGRLRSRRARALVVLALATPIAIFGQLIRTDSSLAPGGMFEASLVHLEGMGTIPGSATSPQREAAYYRLISGGTITFVQAVRNDGRFPITVTGSTGADTGFELRLFAVHDPAGPIDVDTTPTYPFAAFQLAPGQEREIVVVVHLAPCPGNPAPSSEPTPDLSSEYVPVEPYAAENFTSLGLTYSVLGFAREVDVPLFATVVARSPSGSVCGTDPSWTIPAPSVVMP